LVETGATAELSLWSSEDLRDGISKSQNLKTKENKQNEKKIYQLTQVEMYELQQVEMYELQQLEQFD